MAGRAGAKQFWVRFRLHYLGATAICAFFLAEAIRPVLAPFLVLNILTLGMALLACLFLCYLAKRLHKQDAFFLLVLFCLVVVTWREQWQEQEKVSSPSLPKSHIRILAHIQSSPRYRRAGGMEFAIWIRDCPKTASNEQRARTSLPYCPREKRAICQAVELPWRNLGLQNPKAGDLWSLLVSLRPIPAPEFGDFLSYNAKLWKQGLSAKCKIRAAERVQAAQAAPWPWEKVSDAIEHNIRSRLGEQENAGLALSLALGKRDTLSINTDEDFRRIGLAHVLVVSGYHVSMLFLSVSLALRCLWKAMAWTLGAGCPKHGEAGLVILVLAFLTSSFFVAMTGWESASMRALVGLFAVQVAQHLGRQPSALSLIYSVALLFILWSPAALSDPSLHLSCVALIGFALAGRPPNDSLSAHILHFTYTVLLVGLMSSACSAFWFSQFSLVSIPMNLLLGSFLAVLGCQGILLASAMDYFGLDSSGILLSVLGQSLDGLRIFARLVSQQEWSSYELSSPWHIILATLLLACAIGMRNKKIL